jgi:chromosome segregation ATPase
MEALPGPTPHKRPRSALAPGGEVVLLNGPLKGTRRALGLPVTCIGRAPTCDLRLDVEGVSALHCLIVHGPGGFVVRDLGGEPGTQVNGETAASAALHDGDVLTVGSLQLRLRLPRLAVATPAVRSTPPPLPDDEAARVKEALRIQVAAVAAQQAALTDEEGRLGQRRAALEQQEAQLAAHLEEKRQRLVELHAQAQAARATLQRDRETFERHLEKVTGDLGLAERELLTRRQQTEAERRRALSLQRRLRERYRRQLRNERNALRQRQRDLEDLAQKLARDEERLEQERAALAQAVLRFNGEAEVRRRRQQDEAEQLRRQRDSQRAQQEKDEADLAAWHEDLEMREAELARGQQIVQQERQAWHGRRLALEREISGLENRARNQRRKVTEQQEEIRKLEAMLTDLRRQVNPEDVGNNAGPVDTGVSQSSALVLASPAPAPAGDTTPVEELFGQRLATLEGMAGELTDQRLRLAEQWEQLARTRAGWEEEYRNTAGELRLLTASLQEKCQALLSREKDLEDAADELRRRHAELTHLRQHVLGWQARLRSRELTWEAERDRLLSDLRSREALTERHLAALVDLRQRWLKRRRREIEVVQAERAACEKVRQQYTALREQRRRGNRELEEQRGQLTTRALALEQFRHECLNKTADPIAAERRVERLRRRWLTENAAALRALKREREALQAEQMQIEERYAELLKRANELSAETAALSERQIGREHAQAEREAELARARQDLQSMQAQRERALQEVEELRNEVERIARQLLEEPETPPMLRLEQAA